MLAGVILLAGVNGALVGSAATDPSVPPAPPAQGSTPAHQSLANTCVFPDPAGARPVTVDTKAALPKVVQSGKPIQIKDFSLTFTIGAGALGEVTEVEGGATVELTASREDKKTPVPVALTIPATPVPATGELKLVATGKVPDVVMTVAGELRLSTGAPSLALTVPSAKTPLKPITCTQNPDQDNLLGSVVLLGSPKTAKPQTGKPDKTKNPASRNALDEPDPNVIVIALQPFELWGTSSISKLGAFVRLKPAFMFDALWLVKIADPPVPSEITGTTMMPPSKVTILGFGFIPITATMELLPPDYRTGNHIIDVNGTVISEPDGSSTVTTRLEVFGKLSGVTVNGVALDVGDDCVTGEPIVLSLRGEKYDMFNGGVLRTDPNAPDPLYRGFTLPTFSGCGVKEDLDSLLSGMSSGPGNQACVGVSQISIDGSPIPPERKCPNVDPPPARR